MSDLEFWVWVVFVWYASVFGNLVLFRLRWGTLDTIFRFGDQMWEATIAFIPVLGTAFLAWQAIFLSVILPTIRLVELVFTEMEKSKETEGPGRG